MNNFVTTIESLALQLEHTRRYHGSFDLLKLIEQVESIGYTLEDVEVYLETGIKPRCGYDY